MAWDTKAARRAITALLALCLLLLPAFPMLASSATMAASTVGATVTCEAGLTSQHGFGPGRGPGGSQHDSHMPGCVDSYCPTSSGWLPVSPVTAIAPAPVSRAFTIRLSIERAGLEAAPSTPPPKSSV